MQLLKSYHNPDYIIGERLSYNHNIQFWIKICQEKTNHIFVDNEHIQSLPTNNQFNNIRFANFDKIKEVNELNRGKPSINLIDLWYTLEEYYRTSAYNLYNFN